MSFQTPYKYIEADTLASMLKQRADNPRSVVVVDVRDDNVVFHCALSQQRGPKAARIYREVRDATCTPESVASQAQEVLVLRDGFGYFGPKFKQDPQLVEDWDEESWQFR
ncbi:protein-tyrosine-phosphatase [Malassezia caprae]|uniref:Protein-tyrosine-phosphatase n=1 Tax=Malassezia caprae TaxID=1381934 RepID=A0AAF0IW19_9BASI|nr:protein-tyrosine-phosphatase [Malassezia caprae]